MKGEKKKKKGLLFSEGIIQLYSCHIIESLGQLIKLYSHFTED